MSELPVFIITEEEPTPLLRDFDTFVQYLVTHRAVLTQTSEFISGKDLYELNQVMTDPHPDTTPRTSQALYPLLHLFYNLVLGGKLFQKVSKKGGRLFLKPTNRLELYEELRLTDKYFFLLETFWVDTDWQELQKGYFGRSPLIFIHLVLDFISKEQPGKKIPLKGKDASGLADLLVDWEYFLLYFSFFGILEVVRDEDLVVQKWPKRAFRAESITPSSFGMTMIKVLGEERDLRHWNVFSRREYGEWKAIPGSPLPGEDSFEHSEEETKHQRSETIIEADKRKAGDPFFLPFIPFFAEGELQKTLPRIEVKFVDGIYVFKVSLPRCGWRRIEISADNTLDDLHYAIQEAFEFDSDHLYSFFMDGKPWSRQRFVSPYEDEGPWVDEVCIDELGLFVGQNILYLFDYGTEWHFRVELEDIRTVGTKPSEPKTTGWKGKAPKQYGDPEE